MAQRFNELSDKLRHFIRAQKIFFVATATADSRINLSPKGMDTFAVIDNRHIAWLNVTGSGNETAAHVAINPRMTIMFCAFEGDPLILRLYGTAQAVHPRDAGWPELHSLFPPLPGARQIFVMDIELVQTSCGMGVPYFDYTGEREQLNQWAAKKGEEGIRQYWEDRNQTSLDGLPSHIVAD